MTVIQNGMTVYLYKDIEFFLFRILFITFRNFSFPNFLDDYNLT